MDKKKEQQMARRRQEDEMLNRMLAWFGIALGYEAIVLLLKRFYVNFSSTDMGIAIASALVAVFSVLWWVTPLLTAGAAVWLVLWKRQGKPIRLPATCTAVLGVLSVTVILAYWLEDGVDYLGAVAPTVAVLALVYYLYQREFFCNTILAGGGILALVVYRRMYLYHPTMVLAGFILGWVLLAAAAAAAWQLSKAGGKWKKRRLFQKGISYVPTYLTCGVTALTMFAALIGGASVAFYAIFVLVIWLFCMAVYYTVRLM